MRCGRRLFEGGNRVLRRGRHADTRYPARMSVAVKKEGSDVHVNLEVVTFCDGYKVGR